MQVKVSEVPGPRGQHRVVLSPTPTVPHTHGAPFVKHLINVTDGLKDTVASHEVERPANKLQKLLNAQ